MQSLVRDRQILVLTYEGAFGARVVLLGLVFTLYVFFHCQIPFGLERTPGAATPQAGFRTFTAIQFYLSSLTSRPSLALPAMAPFSAPLEAIILDMFSSFVFSSGLPLLQAVCLQDGGRKNKGTISIIRQLIGLNLNLVCPSCSPS